MNRDHGMGNLPAMAQVDVEIGISGCEVAPLQLGDLWGGNEPFLIFWTGRGGSCSNATSLNGYGF